MKILERAYDEGNPGGTGGGDNDTATDDRVQRSLAKLLKRHDGDAASVATLLFTENKEYRDKLRATEATITELKGKVPAEGALVLTPDQAATWQAYQGLGKPEDLEKLKGELTTMQRRQLLSQAAGAHGYKEAVLGTLVGDLPLEIRDVEKDGKKQAAAFVKDDKGQETALPEYAAANWADFLPSLAAVPTPPAGTPFPRQNTGGRPPQPKSIVQQELDKRYNRNRNQPGQGQPQRTGRQET